MSGYVLDGIETALGRTVDIGDGPPATIMFNCRCGWELDFAASPEAWDTASASLRFHYTHCPQAKVVESPWRHVEGSPEAAPKLDNA